MTDALATMGGRSADTDRSELITRGAFYRERWIRSAGIVAILTALRFVAL